MDKNMINIDDLVRQRLSGGEERERPGAWLQMKDLLDQKMPVTRPAGMQWRRMFGVVAGLVLLATATVGSYQVVTSLRKDSAIAEHGGASGKGHDGTLMENRIPGQANGDLTTAAIGDGRVNTNDIQTPPAGKETAVNKQAGGYIAKNNRTSKSVSNIARANTTKTSQSIDALATNQTRAAQSNLPGEPFNTSGLTASSAPINDLGNGASGNDVLSSNTSDISASSASQSAAGQNIKPSSANNKANNNVNGRTANIAKSFKQNKNNEHNSGTNQTVFAAADQQAGANAEDKFNAAENVTKTPENDLLVLKKDTFAQMTIIRRFIVNPLTMSGKYESDTVSIGKIAIDKWVMNEVKNMSRTSSSGAGRQPVAPSASLSLKANAQAAGFSEEMVPLANFKVKSRKTNKWDARGFDEVMRDARFNLAQVKFYPGITGGVNSTVMGADNINGFQLGLSGLFAFGDHWNLLAELKYLQRFNNGSILRDDYQAPDPANSQLTSRVEHFFKFPTLQSIEMPVALRYAINRINLMGGLNMAYNFGLNPEEVTFKYPSEPVAGSPWKNASQMPTVSMDDFNARFSLGYLLGIAYQLSPALQLDMRMTQNVWDNASGSGAQKVSTQLYRSPTFQLSLGYRFSQSQRVPKAVNY